MPVSSLFFTHSLGICGFPSYEAEVALPNGMTFSKMKRTNSNVISVNYLVYNENMKFVSNPYDRIIATGTK